MALQKEIWIADIMEALFANNDFLNYAMNGDPFVENGKTVHLPQAGDPSDIVTNATSFPMDATTRSDADLTFDLDTFYVKPVRIANIDEAELSYDKRASVTRVNLNNLSDRAALTLLYRWMAFVGTGGVAAKVIRTSGTAVAATYNPGVKGAKLPTGNRLALRKEDIKAAQLVMDNDNVPQAGRKMIIPANMFDSLMSDPDLLKRDYAGELDPTTGLIRRLYGFDLIKRSRAGVYDNAATPVAVEPTAADLANQTTANAFNNAAFGWHPDMVYRCKGEIKPFERNDDPLFFGSIISFLMRFGGTKARADGKGAVAIVEAASA